MADAQTLQVEPFRVHNASKGPGVGKSWGSDSIVWKPSSDLSGGRGPFTKHMNLHGMEREDRFAESDQLAY